MQNKSNAPGRVGERNFFRVALVFSLACASALLLTGCIFGASRQSRHNASVVQFLFPNSNPAPVKTAIPTLNLPLRIGLGFVPASHDPKDYYRPDTTISALEKEKLLEEIGKDFRAYKFVKDIEIIPPGYLRPAGGFENLDQVAQMFGLDLIALVSYDQMQFTDQDLASLTYWTIVGAYVIPGDKNDTHTMMDAVVYDVPSRTMLFRAPGSSRVKGRTTPINASEERRKDAEEGFQIAATNLVANLQVQLASFQEKVKARPEEFKVVSRPGYTGGGSFQLSDVTLALLGAGLALVGVTIDHKRGGLPPAGTERRTADPRNRT
jgi:rhombotail lipoprotein